MPWLADQLAEGGEALDLRGHVERGRRLVEDEDVGLGDHRHRGHQRAAAVRRNLVRIAEADGFGVRQVELA